MARVLPFVGGLPTALPPHDTGKRQNRQDQLEISWGPGNDTLVQ